MHTPTRPGTRTRARTQIEIYNTYCYLRAAMIRERASLLHYTYIACLVLIISLRSLKYYPKHVDLAQTELS